MHQDFIRQLAQAAGQQEQAGYQILSSELAGAFSGTPSNIFMPPPSVDRSSETITRKTVDVGSFKEGTIGRYVWTETRVEKYTSVPPQEVLDTFDAHKKRNVFDYYTIASVNAVKDPLLLGRVDGRSERWFIAQWGEDVNLDDVI